MTSLAVSNALPMPASPYRIPPDSSASATEEGASLRSVGGVGFSFTAANLKVRAYGGMARVTLEQTFVNPLDEVLDVHYRFPLPEDGVVVGYAFEIAGRRIEGKVDTKGQARARFTEAVASGHSAALLESSRANIFTQEIGNIPARATVHVEVTLEQRLRFEVSENEGQSLWQFRFPTVIGPRYVRPDDVATAQEVGVRTVPGGVHARMNLEFELLDELPAHAVLRSSSHRLAVAGRAARFLDATGAALDRTLVVEWTATTAEVGVSLTLGRPAAQKPHASVGYGLLCVTPPRPCALAPVARDLLVLLDTSGSMQGAPLAKAQQAVSALLDTLGPEDRFELIEFSNDARRYGNGPIFATPVEKAKAQAWVRGLTANGSTEMYSAVKEALALLRPRSQRQILIVTDGYVGGERELVQLLLERLPDSCRLHVIGIGAEVNRALSAPMARAGKGVEVLIGVGDDVERTIAPLSRRMFRPLLVEVQVKGDALLEVAPAQLPDVFEGAPLLAAVKLRPEGGSLQVSGQTAEGPWSATVAVPAQAYGSGAPGVPALYAREAVADLEARWVTGRDQQHLDAQIESIGIAFQIVTRMTSMVAIDSAMSHPRGEVHQDIVPQDLPYGMTMAGFAGAAHAPSPLLSQGLMRSRAAPAPSMALRSIAAPGAPAPKRARQEVKEDDDDLMAALPASMSHAPRGAAASGGAAPPQAGAKEVESPPPESAGTSTGTSTGTPAAEAAPAVARASESVKATKRRLRYRLLVLLLTLGVAAYAIYRWLLRS
jgi:Ca-activated chloride channel family protein